MSLPARELDRNQLEIDFVAPGFGLGEVRLPIQTRRRCWGLEPAYEPRP
jgi:hypothetical protein